MGKIGKIFLSIWVVLFLIFIGIAAHTFKPINHVLPKDVIKVNGLVTAIQEGSGYDIHFTLKNDPKPYYINRGLEKELTISELNDLTLDKNVTLYCINRWTPFSTDGIFPHISKVEVDGKIIFNEIETSKE